MRVQLRFMKSLRAASLPAAMLVLAMGMVLAVFSLYENVVLRPFSRMPELISIGMDSVDDIGRTSWEDPSPEELKDLRVWPWLEGRPVQQDIRTYRVEAAGVTRSVLVSYASSNFFTELGLRPALGRLFSESESEGAVLSWAAWQRTHGTLALGDILRVDGVSLPILGVLPEGFSGLYPGYEPEVWVSLESRARAGEREARFLRNRSIGIPTFARLKRGLSLAQAQAAFEALMPNWQAQRDPKPQELRARLRPARWMGEQAWGQFLPGSRPLWMASALLLLMACLNLGNLQIARWMREREAWSIRMALGASPARLAWELSRGLLATLLLGGSLALPVAWLIQQVFAHFPPPSEFPLIFRPQMHAGLLLLALGLVLGLALLLLGMAWLWFLRQSTRIDTRNLGGLRWRQALLGAQVAISVLLLCGTLTSAGALHRAQQTPLGLDVRGVTAFSFAMPLHLPGGRPAMIAEWTRLSDHFRQFPELEAACVTVPPCDYFNYPISSIKLVSGAAYSIYDYRIHPGVFSLLRIPLILGRDFSAVDTPEAPHVAIVSASAAQALWPGQDPLGQRMEDSQGRKSQVIGVVADHLWEGLSKNSSPLKVFHCGRQRLGPLMTLMIRSRLPEAVLRERVEREVAILDPRLSIVRAEHLSARVDRMLQPQRLAASLFALMGGVALALCLSGLYALQRYLTEQRLREAGLRMALGATPTRVRLDFLRSLRWPMGLGLGLGGLGTLLVWKLLRSLLVGLPPLNLTGLLLTLGGLAAIAGLAAWLPLRRLERQNPSDLLRDQPRPEHLK